MRFSVCTNAQTDPKVDFSARQNAQADAKVGFGGRQNAQTDLNVGFGGRQSGLARFSPETADAVTNREQGQLARRLLVRACLRHFTEGVARRSTVAFPQGA